MTVSSDGLLFVAEDSGDRNRIAVLADIRGAATVAPFLEVLEAAPGSELTGPTFDPSGSRLFFSSQRGASIRDADPTPTRGITYVVTGPFRPADPAPAVSAAAAAPPAASGSSVSPRPQSVPVGGTPARTGGDSVLGWVAAALAAGGVAGWLARSGSGRRTE